MTFRKHARLAAGLVPVRVAVLAAVAAGLAACGPATSPEPTVVTGTAAPTAAPAPTDPFGVPSFAIPSFSMPSFTSDPELEALLPDEIGGQAVRAFSMTGASFIASGAPGSQVLETVLEQFDAAPDDLSVAFANAGPVSIVAYRIEGVPAEDFFQAFLTAAEQDGGVVVTDVNLGGKAVRRIDGLTTGRTYAYPHEDVLFVVGGDGVSDALLDETFTNLP